MIDISIIMNDAGFRERILAVKSLSDQDFPRERYEIIYVDHYNKPHSELKDYPDVKVICLNEPDPLKTAMVYNAGLLSSKGDLIIVPDADCLMPSNFISSVYQIHTLVDKAAVYFHRLNELIPSKHREFTIEYMKKVCEMTNKRNFGSCLTIKKKWLMEVGGWDETPEQWTEIHCTHKDLNARLTNYGVRTLWRSSPILYHPWHPNTGRSASSKQLQYVETRKRTGVWKSTQLEAGNWP